MGGALLSYRQLRPNREAGRPSCSIRISAASVATISIAPHVHSRNMYPTDVNAMQIVQWVCRRGAEKLTHEHANCSR